MTIENWGLLDVLLRRGLKENLLVIMLIIVILSNTNFFNWKKSSILKLFMYSCIHGIIIE